MLHFFTDPLPGETVLSSILRYCHYTGILYNDTVINLLGSTSSVFPLDLYSFVRNFPSNTSHSVDSLLLNHTCFPAYAPFLDKHTSQNFLKAINTKTSTPKRAVVKENNFIYCPLCVEKDISLYGEPYYHREHQIYGVHVCYLHKCILKEHPLKNPSDLRDVRLDAHNLDLKPRYVTNKHASKLFSAIAYTVHYLLTHDFRYLSREIIESAIFSTLRNYDYTFHEYIRRSLLDEFQYFCGHNVLTCTLGKNHKLSKETFIGQYLIPDIPKHFNIAFDILFITFLYKDPVQFFNSKELKYHSMNPNPPSLVCCNMI